MNILSIDTSTKNLSIAISRDDKILCSSNVKLDKVLSSSIMPKIDKILKKAKMPLGKIDVFVVGLGPGSFTSLRVGLSTIKGLAFALSKPIVGIVSLDALALNVKDKNVHVATISDAKRNLVYGCHFQKSDNKLKKLNEYSLLPIQDFLAKLKGEVVFIGDGIKIFKEDIKKYPFSYTIIEEEKLWFPKAQQLISLAQERLHKNEFDNIDTLVPLYLYPEDCQVQRS